MTINPPFTPVSFPPGPPTTPKWEDPKKVYPPYNGQNQTAKINIAGTVPPMELGPGPADPLLSTAKASYSGSGYGVVGTGKVGTINAGTSIPVSQPAATVQLRFYKGSDGNLYALDNDNNTYMVSAGGALKPVPPVYSPTK